MSVIIEPARLWITAALLLAYAAMCLAIYIGERRKQSAAAQRKPASGDAATWIVAYASQTGSAEDLARQTANMLHVAGVSTHVCALSELNADLLGKAERALFLVSTYGEGDPPDDAAVFVKRWMSTEPSLGHLHYAVLALGDSTYVNYCGFGRSLDKWLQNCNAQTLFDRIDVDQCKPETIDAWRHQLSHLIGTSDASDWSGPSFGEWTLDTRTEINPGSAGAPVYHLELEPSGGRPLPNWQAGDLVQILAPGENRPREYSIASIPEEGRIHLLMRLHRNADGSTGVVSGWIGERAQVGDAVQMRVREHKRFQLGDNAMRPLILIGNGTGMAGLRGHIKARVRSGNKPNWLIFGERNAAHDFHYGREIEAWQASGVLERADLVFSRDQPQRRYVQNRLLEVGDTLCAWINQGAAIYVCGSLEGMAGGVDDALARLLGRAPLDVLSEDGRYRRDVY